eukprot:CAMPEP_0116882266 /NCGR_PEP_ID=MMETSP0463-20121206/14465_1 /TAXON_ID=181622 /ORGANISM="Strombidinopsis sp, Strain SopsisLIS2011" /LENGTH=59 /DNA_ID=CAMNT_0004535213 /DNA_START=2134 /DNA_END=2313 /DNA_ORIENTATION=+
MTTGSHAGYLQPETLDPVFMAHEDTIEDFAYVTFDLKDFSGNVFYTKASDKSRLVNQMA